MLEKNKSFRPPLFRISVISIFIASFFLPETIELPQVDHVDHPIATAPASTRLECLIVVPIRARCQLKNQVWRDAGVNATYGNVVELQGIGLTNVEDSKSIRVVRIIRDGVSQRTCTTCSPLNGRFI